MADYQIDPGDYQPPVEDPGLGAVHPTGHGLIPYQVSPEFTQQTGITPEQYNTFRGYLAHRESSNYGEAPNNLGYMGRYQMGPEEIADASSRMGIPTPSQQQFLGNPELQESLFENYTLDHHNQLMNNPAYVNGNSVVRAALLAGAHLGGPGGVSAWQHGNDRKDENGTSVGNYIQGMGQAMAQHLSPMDVNAGASSNRPVPQPQPIPGAPSGPRNVGPFPDTFSAYQAAPQDKENYHLLESNGQFQWQPISKMQANPLQNPFYTPDQADKIVNHSVVTGPHSWQQQIKNLVGNTGVSFNRAIANMLDLPASVADRALDAISAGTGTRRLDVHFGHPVEGVLNRLGFETEPHDTGDWAGELGTGIGGGLGAAIPFMVGGAIAEPLAGGMGAVRGAASNAPGNTASMVARATGNPASNFGTETSIAAGAGAGQQEAHDIYKGQTGREGDLGDIASQILGGGAWNAARIPLIAAGEKAIAPAFSRAWEAAKGAVGQGAPTQLPQFDQALDAATGAKIANGVLSEQLRQGLNEADKNVAALSTVPTSDSASYLADKSQQATRFIGQYAEQSRQEERDLWKQVNTEMPRDFSKTKQLYQQIKHDFADRPATSGSFPSEFERNLGTAKFSASAPTSYIQDIDTLGRGQDVRAALNGAIENELATGGTRVVNAARLGALQKIRNQLSDDLEFQKTSYPILYHETRGINQQEIDAYQKASSFSQERSKIMESPEMRQFLNSGDSTALEQLVKAGPAGADAVQILTGTAQAKYGTDGLLNVVKDTLRQKYANSVAPNGYISLRDHDRFMNRYGAILDDATMGDVKQQLNSAASAEMDANAVVGFGKQGGFGNTAGTIERRQDAAETYLQAPMDVVMKHLENVSAPALATRRVLQSMENNPEAQKGFMHVVAEKALKDPDYFKNNQGIFQGIESFNPGFMERAEKYASGPGLSAIANQLIHLAPAYVGARIGGHMAENMGSSFVLAGRMSKLAQTATDKLMQSASPIASANIVDPAADQAWSRLISNAPVSASRKAADTLLMHSYVPGLALQQATPGSDAGSGLPGAPPLRGGKSSVAGQEWWRTLGGPSL